MFKHMPSQEWSADMVKMELLASVAFFLVASSCAPSERGTSASGHWEDVSPSFAQGRHPRRPLSYSRLVGKPSLVLFVSAIPDFGGEMEQPRASQPAHVGDPRIVCGWLASGFFISGLPHEWNLWRFMTGSRNTSVLTEGRLLCFFATCRKACGKLPPFVNLSKRWGSEPQGSLNPALDPTVWPHKYGSVVT